MFRRTKNRWKKTKDHHPLTHFSNDEALCRRLALRRTTWNQSLLTKRGCPIYLIPSRDLGRRDHVNGKSRWRQTLTMSKCSWTIMRHRANFAIVPPPNNLPEPVQVNVHEKRRMRIWTLRGNEDRHKTRPLSPRLCIRRLVLQGGTRMH